MHGGVGMCGARVVGWGEGEGEGMGVVTQHRLWPDGLAHWALGVPPNQGWKEAGWGLQGLE